MAKLTVVEAINLALKQEMEKDPRVLILGEDVGKNGGVFRVTQGICRFVTTIRRQPGRRKPLAKTATYLLGLEAAAVEPALF